MLQCKTKTNINNNLDAMKLSIYMQCIWLDLVQVTHSTSQNSLKAGEWKSTTAYCFPEVQDRSLCVFNKI